MTYLLREYLLCWLRKGIDVDWVRVGLILSATLLLPDSVILAGAGDGSRVLVVAEVDSTESGEKSMLAAPCSEADQYIDLLQNVDSGFGAVEESFRTCFELIPGHALFLWFPGCLSCHREFADVVFPAAIRFPHIRRMAATGLVVESVEESEGLLNAATHVITSIPGHAALPHLVIERGRGEVGRALEQLLYSRSEGLPGFLFCCEPGPVLVSIGGTDAIDLSFASGDYYETLDKLIEVWAMEGNGLEAP